MYNQSGLSTEFNELCKFMYDRYMQENTQKYLNVNVLLF